MEIHVTYFKRGGKYYTDQIIKHDKDIPLYRREFIELLINNSEVSNPEDYIIVVDDVFENQSFHMCLIHNINEALERR